MEPLPPVKEVEYRCYIGKMFDDISGIEYTTFSFETSKEFSSFRYEIAVRYRVEPGSLTFRVLGMTATRMMMPSFGTARSILKVPHLVQGEYLVTFIKSDGSENQFMIDFSKKGFQILKPIPRKRFIDLIIDDRAAAGGAKITTTVAKAPTLPLVPRTIQKRQPAPPTPEELEILAALKTETPEERDAREEQELFGGKKKVSKKDLVEYEKEIKKIDKTAATPAKKAATKEKKPVKKVAAAKPVKKVTKKALPAAKKKTTVKAATKPKSTSSKKKR